MKNLNKLIERRNKLIKEYISLAEKNMDNKIYSDRIELTMLDNWSNLNSKIIQLRLDLKQAP